MRAQDLFSGMTFVPGVGYVQGGSTGPANFATRAGRGLGDEGAVMMISGLGASGDPMEPVEGVRAFMPPGSMAPPGAGSVVTTLLQPAQPAAVQMAPQHDLQKQLTLFNVTLPVWAWLTIAALLGGAGGAGLSRWLK